MDQARLTGGRPNIARSPQLHETRASRLPTKPTRPHDPPDRSCLPSAAGPTTVPPAGSRLTLGRPPGLALPRKHPPAYAPPLRRSPAAPPPSGTPAGYARPCQNIRPPTCRRLQFNTTRPPHATGCRTIIAVHPAINGSIQAKLPLCPRPGAAPCPLLRGRLRVHPSGGGSVGRTRAPPSGGGPACPSARGRRRVPPSGRGPVNLAPGAPPSPLTSSCAAGICLQGTPIYRRGRT